MKTAPQLEEALARPVPITLEEMDRVQLQSRMDTKYIFAESALPGILAAIRDEYRILEVQGTRGTGYRTLYFDTADRKFFLDHHNERVFRSKVRFREYVGSGLCFLEVKRKTGRGGTDKQRMPVDAITGTMSAEEIAFVQQASGCLEPLMPVLWNTFTRYTLVHAERHERLTIDRALRFSAGTMEQEFDGVCVAELKEERGDHASPFARAMKGMGIRPEGMSKYCVGLVLLGLAPKVNNFKPILLRAEKLRAAA